MTTKVGALRDLLTRAVGKSDATFSGIGVVVYRDLADLPVFPLRRGVPERMGEVSTDDLLSEIASSESEFHDGFHLLSADLIVTHVAQYFSPPIVANVATQEGMRVGGRYMAALFGSRLKSAVMTAVVGADCRLAIFVDGKEVHREALK